MNIFKNTVLIIAALLLFTGQAHPQAIIQRIVIDPLNRAAIYCSQMPGSFKSRLSDDKKKIMIDFKNASVEESAREAHGQGIIQDVYIQRFGEDLQANVILKDKRGYTVLPLEYSQALFVEVFKWDDQSPADEFYREGILALETSAGTQPLIPSQEGMSRVNISQTKNAKNNFVKAANEEHTDAAALLGILLLKEGRQETALKLLKYSKVKETSIPDAYAALSQIYGERNIADKSQKNAEIFYGMTGKENFPVLSYPEINPVDSAVEKELSAILAPKKDSVFSLKNDSLKKDDSLAAKRFPNLFGDTAKKAEDYGLKIFPELSPAATALILIIFAGFGTLLVVSYLRWRKKQIEKIQRQVVKQNRGKVVERLESVQEERKKEKEKYREALKKERERRKKTEEIAVESEKEKLKKEKSPAALADKVEDLAKKILDEKKRESGIQSETSSLPPKVELALHLQQEQSRLKRQSISEINEKELAADPKKLAETAKKLGIDIGSLETKQAVEKLLKDKDYREKLGKKFKK